MFPWRFAIRTKDGSRGCWTYRRDELLNLIVHVCDMIVKSDSGDKDTLAHLALIMRGSIDKRVLIHEAVMQSSCFMMVNVTGVLLH